MQLTVSEIYNRFIMAGASHFQALMFEQAVNAGGEISSGIVYKQMRAAGIDIVRSKCIELTYWKIYDESCPPSPYERAFTAFTEKTSNRKYNQIPIF